MKILCFLGKHKLYPIKHLGYKSDLIGCKRCKGFWGMNHEVKAILPFDEELYEMYKSFGEKGLKKYISHKRFAFYW